MRELVTDFGPAFVQHVLVSTFVLLLALAAVTWIRPITARTRHAILFAGLASFAVPSPLLSFVIEQFRIPKPIGLLMPMRQAADALTTVTTARATLPWMETLVTLWLLGAALILGRWWLVSRRLVVSALRTATPPPARAVNTLRSARKRLALGASVDLLTSPLCEAPAVVRVLRPFIVLPEDGIAALDDDELESLLCHECAHVARRDNLLGVFEQLICALFWFNPVVWLAHQRIAAAREAACDELVADSASRSETYVGALAKICQSLLVPRVAGVSCMASAHLKERIQHLMRYESLRNSALSHRLTSIASAIAVLLFVVAAGVVTAKPAKKGVDRYLLNYKITKNSGGSLVFATKVVDTDKAVTVAQPVVVTDPGNQSESTITDKRTGREWRLLVDAKHDGSGKLTLVAFEQGLEVQKSSFDFAAPAAESAAKQWQGEPISLNLQNADLIDVLKTFQDLTGLDIRPAPEVKGVVNVKFNDIPWDQALHEVITDNGYTYRLKGNKMEVFR